MADSPLSQSLAVLSLYFVGGEVTLRDTLQRVSELAGDAVGPADFVGLTMPVEGAARTAVFTDPASPQIDQVQYDTGEGPCLNALRDKRVYSIDSTREDGPWPAFRRACMEHGVHSTLSLPLLVDEDVLGAMNMYSRTERAFRAVDREAGLLFAAQAAVVLANARAYADAHELSSRLGDAMKSRSVIEQAKGILMCAQRCDADDAFELLVKASQRENTKLRDIAQRIVDNAPRPATPSALTENDV